MNTRKCILTIRDVAQEFGLHPLTVSRLARQGVLPGFKIGGSWRFRRDVLEDWMINRTQVARLRGSQGRSGKEKRTRRAA